MTTLILIIATTILGAGFYILISLLNDQEEMELKTMLKKDEQAMLGKRINKEKEKEKEIIIKW